jgi:DNA-binding response OmpR family regulator
MKIGDLELDIEAYRLSRSGEPLKIERIPMELLLLLARNRGKLVTREQVISQIWGASHFIDSESAINTAVRKLRKVLQDDPGSPNFIETVPAKGYRLSRKRLRTMYPPEKPLRT